MRDFSYLRAGSLDEARNATRQAGAMVLAGGTTLLDLAKCGVADPETVIDITHLPGLADITVGTKEAKIGALARMSDVSDHPDIRRAFPAIAESLSLAASAQLRNMATIGGNLLQRTRCSYFRDPGAFSACNKRDPGSGCSAIGGITRNHAVLGTSDACIASYPGDLAVALVAFDATIEWDGRKVSVEEFFLAPGETPDRETVLQPGEIISAVTIATSDAAANSTYLKIRDRQSYEFAAASAAVGVAFEEDGKTIRELRVALGGVATRPWRAHAVEQALIGKVLEPRAVEEASSLAMKDAVVHGGNRYKIELAPRVLSRAILQMGGLA